jgi:hypothetical protein
MSKKKNDDLDLNDLEMLDPNYLEKELNKKIENSEYVQKSTSQGLIFLAKNHALANGAIDWIKTLYKNHVGKIVLNEKDLVQEDRLRKGPKARGKQITRTATNDHKLIQSYANSLWAEDNKILVRDMAKICEKYTLAQNTTSKSYKWKTIYNRIISKPKK